MVQAQTYSRVAIWLHWLIAFMIIGGKIMMAMPNAPIKFEVYQLHKSFGIMILLFSFVRLGWRFSHKVPPLPDGMKSYEKFGARATHIGFYILMIAAPLSGWIMSSASTPKITTKIFKAVTLPDFPGISRSEAGEVFWKNTHEILAYIIIAMLILHIGAALKHHFVNKDDVLSRMVTIIKPKG